MADPLDLEKAVALLTESANAMAEQRTQIADEADAQLLRETENIFRSLASQLPLYVRDGELMDELESWTKGDQMICPPGNHGGDAKHWLVSREDDVRGDNFGAWCTEYEGATLRDAIDAARSRSLGEKTE